VLGAALLARRGPRGPPASSSPINSTFGGYARYAWPGRSPRRRPPRAARRGGPSARPLCWTTRAVCRGARGV